MGFFGETKAVSTLSGGQQQGMDELMADYRRQILNGPQADYGAVDRYLSARVNPEINKNYDNSWSQQKASMGTNFWGSDKISALARLQKNRDDALSGAKATAYENERQSAQNRYDSARQGLSGLMNVQTKAYMQKPGFIDKASQVAGLGANLAAIGTGSYGGQRR